MNETNEAPSNISVTIKFFSTLKNTAGVGEVTLQLTKGVRLIDVLKQVEDTYFAPKRAYILEPEQQDLTTGTICLINDADHQFSGGFKQKLQDTAIITLISSLHGG